LAIFGKLSDFSLREVISMVGRRSGALLLESGDGSRVQLQISDAQVARITVERRVRSADEAAQLLRDFVRGQGWFHFEQRNDDVPQDGTTSFDWQQLIPLPPETPPPGEVRARTADLPHPETCFVLIKGRSVQLDSALTEFLQQSSPRLERGASAEQISEALRLPLETVQWHLQSLRELKKIWPVRAHVEPVDAPKKKERTSLGRRLLSLILK
jgi:hypothetical protein